VTNKLLIEKFQHLKKDYKEDALKLVEIKKIENGISEKEHYSPFSYFL
jgi:hypothetical protein